MANINEINITEREKINKETALINWLDLQTYFAAGNVVYVSNELNLLDVAEAILKDDKELVSGWMDINQVNQVTDEQAKDWFEKKADVWAVVVKPFVLVQNQKT